MDVLTISLGRNILDTDSRERARMSSYAKYLESFHIIVLTRKEHGYEKEQHDGNLHLYPTHSISRPMMLWDAFRIGAKIAQKKRDSQLIISAQDPLEIGWICWVLSRMKNTRLHIQVHGDYFSSNVWVENSVVRRLRRRIALYLLKHSPAIRVVSNRIKRSLMAQGIPEEKITVFPIRPELEEFLNTEHIVSQTPPYTFLFLGRLAPEKNIPRILYAFARVLEKHPKSKLRIVGEGSEKESVARTIAELNISGSVSMVPWTNDVATEMSHADIFLLASKHEAYALTLIEAMGVGLPLITTDVGCVGEIVMDSVNGIVVKEEGIDSYAHAMQTMIENDILRETCSIRNRETVRTLAHTSVQMYAQEWVTAVNKASEKV